MKISFFMIVRDEERFVADCLNSVKDFVDEIIVVDTDSADKTVEIAKKIGAKVYNYSWDDNFSNARNFALGKTTGDWVLYLDADEVIGRSYMKKLKDLTKLVYDGYCFEIIEYTNDENRIGFIAMHDPHLRNRFGGFVKYVSTPRFFRNNNEYKFEHPVHETIGDSILRAGGQIATADITIHHYELLKDNDNFVHKQRIYNDLLIRRAEKNPDAKTYCDIAVNYFKYLGDTEKAVLFVQKARAIDSKYARCHIILGEIYVKQNKLNLAIKQYDLLVAIGKELDSAYYNLGQIYSALNEKDKAIENYELALKNNSQHRQEILNKIEKLQKIYK